MLDAMERLPFATRVAAVALVVVAVDEAVKTLARTHLSLCTERLPACDRLDLLGSLWLVRTGNAGSAFGLGQGLLVWVLLALAGALLIPVYARWLRGAGWLAALAVGLQVGGALGNVGDRLLLGGATDVLFLGQGPVWNLADVALLCGMLLATWSLVRSSTYVLNE
jgi:signal peptidase II